MNVKNFIERLKSDKKAFMIVVLGIVALLLFIAVMSGGGSGTVVPLWEH